MTIYSTQSGIAITDVRVNVKPRLIINILFEHMGFVVQINGRLTVLGCPQSMPECFSRGVAEHWHRCDSSRLL